VRQSEEKRRGKTRRLRGSILRTASQDSARSAACTSTIRGVGCHECHQPIRLPVSKILHPPKQRPRPGVLSQLHRRHRQRFHSGRRRPRNESLPRWRILLHIPLRVAERHHWLEGVPFQKFCAVGGRHGLCGPGHQGGGAGMMRRRPRRTGSCRLAGPRRRAGALASAPPPSPSTSPAPTSAPHTRIAARTAARLQPGLPRPQPRCRPGRRDSAAAHGFRAPRVIDSERGFFPGTRTPPPLGFGRRAWRRAFLAAGLAAHAWGGASYRTKTEITGGAAPCVRAAASSARAFLGSGRASRVQDRTAGGPGSPRSRVASAAPS
jgi:hypothetical protein